MAKSKFKLDQVMGLSLVQPEFGICHYKGIFSNLIVIFNVHFAVHKVLHIAIYPQIKPYTQWFVQHRLSHQFV